MTKKVLPKIIEEVGFDFNWSEKKVWALDIPVEKIDIMENKGRWLILDGLHRLVKAKILGKTTEIEK